MEKNSKERMIEGVNKIIAQKLLSSESVYLPSIGSIAVRLKPAEMHQSRECVSAPVKTLQFTATAEGESLVDLIQNNAGCTQEQAEVLFQKYIGSVRTLRGIEVAGVGTLVDRSFMTYREFAALLNPINEVKAPMKRQKNIGNLIQNLGVITVLLVAILFCIQNGYFDGILSCFKGSSNDKFKNEYYTEEEVEIVPTDPVTGEPTNITATETTAVAQEAESAEKLPVQSIAQDKSSSTNHKSSTQKSSYNGPRYGVVYGVFANPANVQKARRSAVEVLGNVDVTTHKIGANTAVLVYRSNSRDAARRFLNRNYEKYPPMWIYELK